MLFKVYNKVVLEHPKVILGVVVFIVAFFLYHVPKFDFSASSDSLLLESDQELKFYRQIRARYGADDFLVITYTPKDDLFNRDTLHDIQELQNQLSEISRVDSVISILNVPLIKSPPIDFTDLAANKINKLEDGNVNLDLARKELTTSPLYENLLISSDAKHTALVINFKRDKKYTDFLTQKNLLLEKEFAGAISAQEQDKLVQISKEFKEYKKDLVEQEARDIRDVRSIMSAYKDNVVLHLGGVPMIVADSVDFIENDVFVFGIGVFCFIVIILAFSFRSVKFIFISLLNCLIVATVMIGLLGFLSWDITVVSSNFAALLFIITLAIMVHLIVCYEEMSANNADLDQKSLINLTLKKITLPCFYTTITTMVAFSSLILSDIRPIIDFGWIMTIGIGIAFIVSFVFFPTVLLFFKPKKIEKTADTTDFIIKFFVYLVDRRAVVVMLSFVVITIVAIIGISRLTVENSFIDYFKKSTEIYQGMKLIDENFGGTIPLDIIISAPEDFVVESDNFGNIFADEEFMMNEEPSISSGYWFNSFMLNKVSEIHEYLDSVPQIGKVLSLSSTVEILQSLNNEQPIDGIVLNTAYNKSSPEIRNILFKPYIADDGNQIRLSARIYESLGVKHNDLLAQINQHLTDKLGYEKEQVHLTGMLVLYNNILNSLFKSQILTLGIVFLAIWGMFVILFRNIKTATIVIIPNIIAASVILGVMGIFNIPLNIMTITVAAICVGIAVDDAIHYTHRFLHEYKVSQDYKIAIHRSHLTIGRAMFFTTITITLGFSILMLSNFVPTIYFSFLTGASMVFALVANITLLPLLLKWLRVSA